MSMKLNLLLRIVLHLNKERDIHLCRKMKCFLTMIKFFLFFWLMTGKRELNFVIFLNSLNLSTELFCILLSGSFNPMSKTNLYRIERFTLKIKKICVLKLLQSLSTKLSFQVLDSFQVFNVPKLRCFIIFILIKFTVNFIIRKTSTEFLFIICKDQRE
jgi:hypothetical protein